MSRTSEQICAGELPLKLEDVREPMDLEKLGGQPQVLAAKQDELPLFPGDIVQYTWQGGGGYGDPLARVPAAVAADVASGYISGRRALDVYGVVSGEDPAKTEQRRERMRQQRLANADLPSQGSDTGRKSGVALSRFGAGLVLAHTEKKNCNSNANAVTYSVAPEITGKTMPPATAWEKTNCRRG